MSTISSLSATPSRPRSSGARRRQIPEGLSRWLLSVPLLIFLTGFAVIPIIYGVWVSVTDESILSANISFVGLANYVTVLTDPAFWQALWFTAWYSLASTALALVTGFFLAVLVNRRFPGKRGLLTILLLPIIIAPALMGLMFRLALNGDTGIVPAVLNMVGLNVSLFDPHTTTQLLVCLEVLQWTPFTFLILYAGLQALPQELFEAASLDGATRWQSLVHVTLPMMRPVLFAAGFLRVVDALRTFDVIYVLTSGGPGTITTNLSIYVYKRAFVTGDFGAAEAAAFLVMLIILPFVPVIIARVVVQPKEA